VFLDDTIQSLHNGNINKKIIRPISYTSSLSKDTFLTYANPTYGIKIQYPYNWIIEGTNYLQGKGGVQIAAFYLSNISEGLPFIRVGIDNLTKEFPKYRGQVSIFDYLKKALEGKDSTGFPGFRLIESNVTTTTTTNSNDTLAANHITYRIMWTYIHPTFGIRKSIEVGTVIGNKGYFIDYTANTAKFSNHLQIVKRMISSFGIIENNNSSKSSRKLQANAQMQEF
jgi:hypothetical protein